MTNALHPDNIRVACTQAAKSLGISVEQFMRAVFEMKQAEYDHADIRQWLQDQGYKYTEDDVAQIHETLRDDWDADLGTWANISSSYYNNRMDLPFVDDEEEEAECCDCGYDEHSILMFIIDANGIRVLCPNCCAKRIAEDNLPFMADIRYFDDISGESGAVQLISGDDERYTLKPDTMHRLLARALTPEEWKALTGKYGSDLFLLHEDFYDENGNALQPLI